MTTRPPTTGPPTTRAPKRRPPRPQWTLRRPESSLQDLTNLADELKSLPDSTITAKEGVVRIRLPTWVIKTRHLIAGDDNACLSQKISFIAYFGSAVYTDLPEGEITGTAILEYKEYDKNCASLIEGVIYKKHGTDKISLHNLDRSERHMVGGDFVGGTRSVSERTPGFFSIEGAEFEPRMYLNPKHPQYNPSHLTPTTQMPRSQRKRPTALDTGTSELDGDSNPKKQCDRSQNAPGGSSENRTDAAGSSRANPSQPKTSYRRLLPSVRNSTNDDTAAQSQQSSTDACPQSDFFPNKMATAQQEVSFEPHSQMQAAPSETPFDPYEAGEKMLTKRLEEYYGGRGQAP